MKSMEPCGVNGRDIQHEENVDECSELTRVSSPNSKSLLWLRPGPRGWSLSLLKHPREGLKSSQHSQRWHFLPAQQQSRPRPCRRGSNKWIPMKYSWLALRIVPAPSNLAAGWGRAPNAGFKLHPQHRGKQGSHRSLIPSLRERFVYTAAPNLSSSRQD